MRSCSFILVYAFFVGIFTLSSAHAVEYTFTPIAPKHTEFVYFRGASINDGGAVSGSGCVPKEV